MRRLHHATRLGVDAVWLSPFFPSPMCDGGYDVAEQCDVDPRFGTLADFDALVVRAHDLGLLVMIDQVFNHTSDRHPWFDKSLNRDPDFEDFYVWADARPDGGPPSNWIGYFGHPAWRWHPRRGQYCLHQFLPCQPGLNHYNPKVHESLRNITRFWRDRGVDGFRYDAVTSFFHDPRFRDNPPAQEDAQARIPGPPNNPFTLQRHVQDMLPGDCAAFARDIREWAGPDSFLLGEINSGPNSVEVLREFTGDAKLDAGYTVDLPERGLTGTVLADVIDRLGAPGPLAWWLSSHDQKRPVSRDGDGSARDARMMAALLLALPGPLLIFQGEELGMLQADLSRDQLRDPFDLAYWPDMPGRDGARTPMVWDDVAPGHGFTSGSKSWLQMVVPPDGSARHQWQTQGSAVRFYADTLAQRRKLGLADGDIEVVRSDETLFVARVVGRQCGILLAANLDGAPRDVRESAGMEVHLTSADQPDEGRLASRSVAWFR